MAYQPLRDPTFEVGSWMLSSGGQFLPGVDIVEETTRFERRLSVQTSSKANAIARQTRFINAMKKFCAERQDPDLADFDIRGEKGGWSAVLNKSEAALQQYGSKRKGWKGIFRNMDIAIGKAADQIEPFLELLPCGEYTSVVCGGVKLIFTAFKNKAEAQEKVMETLGEAPEYLEQAETFLALYFRDEELERRVDELYMELLAAIEGVIGWLASKSKRFRSMFPSSDLIETRLKVDQCRKRVIARADDCNKAVTVQNNEMTRKLFTAVIMLAQQNKDNNEQVRRLAQGNAELMTAYMSAQKLKRKDEEETRAAQQLAQAPLNQSLDEIKLTVSVLTQASRDIQSSLSSSLAAAQQRADLREKALQVERDKTSSLEAQKKTLENKVTALEQLQHAQQQQKLVSQVYVVREAIEAERLIQWLATPSASSNIDAAINMQQTRALETGRRLSNVVTKSPRLLKWLSSDDSSMIFIEPIGSIARYPKGSPGSFVTASIAHVLDEQDYALVLKHFCAQSQYKTRGFDRVSDVLGSLITQLLDLYPFDLSLWTSNPTFQYSTLMHRDLAEERDLRYLCQLLEYLVTSLEINTAFILIDDFYLLERSAEDTSLDEMFYTFQQIMAVSPALKVLCMTPEMSEKRGHISGRIDDHNKLRLNLEDIERGGDGTVFTRTGMRAPLSAFVDND